MSKVWNIILLSYALAIVGSFGIAIASSNIFSADIAPLVAVTGSLLLGFYSRTIVQKIIGYTMQEAIAEEIEKHTQAIAEEISKQKDIGE